jgi:hypothetical protein
VCTGSYGSGTVGPPGPPGPTGTAGYTPIKGIDYFDGATGTPGYTPVKGIDYFDGATGTPGYTPIKGIDYFDGATGSQGVPGPNLVSSGTSTNLNGILMGDGFNVGIAQPNVDYTALVNPSVVGNFVSFSNLTGAQADSGYSAGSFALLGHNHAGVYEPVDATIVRTGDANWIDLTDGGATALHTHAGIGSPSVLGNGAMQYQTIITGATPFAPVYSGFLLDGTTGGKTVFAVTNTKTLTLTATDSYNLTVPATLTVAGLGIANIFTTTQSINPSSDVEGLIIKMPATPTKNAFEIKNNAGTVLSQFDANGRLGLGTPPASATLKVGLTLSSATYVFAFDFQPNLTSSAQHVYGGYFMPTITIPSGKWAVPLETGSPSVTVGAGAGGTYASLYVAGINTLTGTLVTMYGIYMEDISKGTTNYALNTGAGSVVINRGGDSLTDFTVKSDTYNAIFIDASNDSIVLMSNAAGKVGLFGHAASPQPAAYTPSNVTTTRTFNANATTLDEIADVLGTLIADIQSLGAVG